MSTATASVTEVRTYEVRTYGCQMNAHDSERLAGSLEAAGYRAASDEETPDVVVFNTCAVRENADNRLYGNLGHLAPVKEANPGMQIAVGGCLAQKDRGQILDRAPWVDVVFGTHNVGALPVLLERARVQHEAQVEILESLEVFPSTLPTRRESAYAAWVSVSVGCNNTCTFCIVPALRGVEKDRRPGDILNEIRALVDEGVLEITLLGQNVNSYGRDLGAGQYRPQFADLLRAIDAVPGIQRVRYTSPHPKDLRPDTIAAMAECSSVCEHLHLPLQAGSNTVLARMHRGYRADRYLDKLADARASIDDLAVTTDIIVGFPGETDADFDQTLEVVDAAAYDSAYTFIFSPRPGTPAADMVDDFVAADVAHSRMTRLTEIVERHALARHEARVGRVEEVLVEGPSKKDASKASGRTRQNKLVHFAATGAAARPGTYATVEITRAAPHWLRGELVEVVAPAPAPRVRIPIAAG